MKYTNQMVASFIALITLTAGCASMNGAEDQQNLAKLEEGMSQSQVRAILGTPDSVIRTGAQDRWIYKFSSEKNRGHNVTVEFNSGSLTKMEELSGREIAAAEENRIPGNCTRWPKPDFIFESLCTR